MSDLYIQSMVNCGSSTVTVGGYGTIYHSTNGSDWTAVSIAGWFPFKEYLSTFSAALPATLSITYDEASDRCKIEVSDSTTYHVKLSLGISRILGFNAATIATAGNDVVGDFAPYGICPITSGHFANPRPAKKSNLAAFRHGVSHSSSFGSGALYDIKLTLTHANRERLTEGPCGIGKVRIGAWDASAVFSGSALDGYLDAYLIQQPSLVHSDFVESHVDASFTALAPSAAHSSAEEMGDAVLGSLKRGWGLVYYARIEGLPYVFTEKSTGITSSSAYPNHTESATLVISDGTSLTQKIERSKGFLASTGLNIGILDPANDLGIFQRPTLKIALGSDLAYNATTATIDQDSGATSSWPAGGASDAHFWIGKEFFKFGSRATENFSSLTRGSWGPKYEYKSDGPASFKTLTNAPTIWRGRVTELWCMAVDAFGSPVSTDYDDAHCLQLYTGDLTSFPAYENGVWVFQTRDLVRRLSSSTGLSATGDIAAQFSPKDYGSTMIKLPEGAMVKFTYRLENYEGAWGMEDETVTVDAFLNDYAWGSTVTNRIVTARQFLKAAFAKWHGYDPDWTTTGSNFLGSYLEFDWGTGGGAFENGDEGLSYSVMAHNETSFMKGELTIRLFAGAESEGDVIWEAHISSLDAPPAGYKETDSSDPIPLSGKRMDHLFLREHQINDALAGSFASSGTLIVGEGENAELVKYTAKESIPQLGSVVCLTGISRGLSNTKRADFFDPDLKVYQAHRETLPAGQMMAQIIESSAIATELRGTYDLIEVDGFGYGIDSAHVLESDTSAKIAAKAIPAAMGFPASITATLAGKQMTFEAMFSGLLAANRIALAWVRSGTRLKLGIVRTDAAASSHEVDHTITDADLQLTNSARIAALSEPPNIVRMSRSETLIDRRSDEVIYRLIPDIAARGGYEAKFQLYGLNDEMGLAIMGALAAGMIQDNAITAAYTFRVAAWRDWQCGDLVKFDSLSHGSLWDWVSGAAGLDSYGRIIEVQRNLTSGDCQLRVIVEGMTFSPLLCPAAVVTSASSADLTVDSVEFFNQGDPVLVLTPGVAGSYEENSIASINASTKVLTLSSAPTVTPTANKTVVTFPSNDNGSITALQNAHAHVNDGGQWV